jgi:hypothetical protein
VLLADLQEIGVWEYNPLMARKREKLAEITPELLDAGVAAWDAWEAAEDWSIERLVTSVYLTMLSSALGEPELARPSFHKDALARNTDHPIPRR